MKKLSVVIPVFNEEKSVKKLLRKVMALDLSPIDMEIIIVDDGSTDSTVQKIKEAIGKKKKYHFSSNKNKRRERKCITKRLFCSVQVIT